VSSLVSAVKRVVQDLSELKVRFAIVGALAIGSRGRVRQTLDADIAVSLPDINKSDELINSLVLRGYGINNLYRNESKLALARLFSPDNLNNLFEIDLLFDLCGIEQEVIDMAEVLEIWPGISAPIARMPALLAMKARCQELPERIQDKADLVNQLIPFATLSDIEEARILIQLVEQRGYNEGRSLLQDFNMLVASVKRK